MRHVLRAGRFAVTYRRRPLIVGLILTLVLAVSVLAALSIGDVFVPPNELATSFVATELRLPRTVLAVVAGAAFGLSGALIQSVSRNPLAGPDIIGVTQGAGLAATLALTSGAALAVVAPAALLGGLLAAALVFTLGARQGLSARRFVLAGVAVAFALRALIEVVIVAADAIDGQRAQIWLVGTLAGRGYTEALTILVVLALLSPALLWAGRALDVSTLDDDTVRGLGVRPNARRIGLATAGVLAAAVVTAQVGAVDFVALVAPQVAQRLVRDGRPPLLNSALAGAVLLVLADLAGRRLFSPTQLPAGVLTAALGGGYLLYLLVRRRRKS